MSVFRQLESELEEYPAPNHDEELAIQGNNKVWMVKIPPFLMARWEAVTVEDAHLATIRIYEDPAKPGEKPRIILFLPPNHDPSLTSPPAQNPKRPKFDTHTRYDTVEPDTYDLEVINKDVVNRLIIAERPKDTSSSALPKSTTNPQPPESRAISTSVVGRIHHECRLRPCLTGNYWKHKREQNKKLAASKRSIRMIEDTGISRSAINVLSSAVGAGAGNAFSNFVETKPKPTKGKFVRNVRIPSNQLMDALFKLFEEKPRRTMKNLKEETQQPEAYLREVLVEIAFIHRSGDWNGMWEVNKNFKEAEKVKEEIVPVPNGIKMEDIDFDYDDDSDDDLEQIS